MLFNSEVFLFYFLPVVAVSTFVITRFVGKTPAMIFVVVASFVFYGWSTQSDVLLLGSSIGINYAVATRLVRQKCRATLTLGIAFNLALLFYFKYTGFFFSIIGADALGAWSMAEIALPLAISFFTFQQIAYLVDVYERKTQQMGFAEYAFFVSFFPQLIAGPIVHHSEIANQLPKSKAFRFDLSNVTIGICILFVGVYKKVVFADSIGTYADTIFANAATGPGFIEAWAGALAYAFQIYFDFSGYSDMAIGIARIFGINLPLNFASPYKAKNIIDFWRTWHITLSRFLRDYLYYPLGGNRYGKLRRYVNLMVVMVLGGLWHGAAWSFVIWGALHGLYLIINHGYRHICERLGIVNAMPSAVSRTLTFGAVVISWVFFRAENLDAAFAMLSGMFGLNGIELSMSPNVTPMLLGWIGVLWAVTWFGPSTQKLFNFDKGNTLETVPFVESVRFRQTRLAQWIGAKVAALAMLFSIAIVLIVVILRGNESNLFIYMYF